MRDPITQASLLVLRLDKGSMHYMQWRLCALAPHASHCRICFRPTVFAQAYFCVTTSILCLRGKGQHPTTRPLRRVGGGVWNGKR
jgi:hypothetical protein